MVKTIWLVLTAYNEEANLASLLGGLRLVCLTDKEHDIRLVIVDDGSQDGTAKTAQDFNEIIPTIVIRHRVNQGLGASLRDGLRYAVGNAPSTAVIITMDADNTHPVELIPEMVAAIESGADVVIASRYHAGAKVVGLAWYRRFLSVLAAQIMRVLFPCTGLRDYTCGFRAYRNDVLKRAFTTFGDDFVGCAGFQCTADILLKLRMLSPPVQFTEVPLTLRYDRKRGKSKMKVLRTILGTLHLIIKRRMGSVR